MQTVALTPVQVYPAKGPVLVGLHPGSPPVQQVSGPTHNPSVRIGVQDDGVPEQVQPASTVQVFEHPSPVFVLLSSQASVPLISPSPHIGLQVSADVGVPPAHNQPTAFPPHPTAQPIPSLVPSSHTSDPSLSPSPHMGVQTEGAPVQVHPVSIVQVEVHPSPLATPLSSQVSGEITSPSPHRTLQTEAVVGVPEVQ